MATLVLLAAVATTVIDLATVTKNRSIMVVSDHNRPVHCIGIALFWL
ncbi:MAG TPA: hypothetical protein IAA29_08000 [Candidatus Paenibacillus intestinavium]|nr:hypothetical protein [Candidatus Paenibacillus intestinavium]